MEAETGARDLFASLRQIAALGDDVEVWPAHVGGSLCGGGALSGRTVSTVGQERDANRAFGLADEAAFVTSLTQTLPRGPPTSPTSCRSTATRARPPASRRRSRSGTSAA